jgi:hypothetical protein
MSYTSYICRTAPLTSRCCILNIYSTNDLLNILNMLHNLRYSPSKCRLFHNALVFGSCVIHISNTGVLKFKRKFRRQMVNNTNFATSLALLLVCKFWLRSFPSTFEIFEITLNSESDSFYQDSLYVYPELL